MFRPILATAVALAPALVQAAHPLITEDTGTQGAQRRQLEVFGEETKDRGTRRRTQRYDAVLSYGIADSADVQVGLPWYRSGPDGVGDLSLDLKWRFFQRDTVSLALKPGITLPTGDERDGHGTGRSTWGSLFIFSWEPGATALHMHAGYRRNENKLGEREVLHQLAAAATYRVGNVKLVGELARETNPVPGGRTVRYSTAGLIWSLSRDLDFSFGWRAGHGGATLDHALLLGAALRW